MRRALFGAVIGLVCCAFGPLAAEDPGKGAKKSAPPTEKADNSVDRSLTGHVEKIDATDEHHGTFVLKSSNVAASGEAGTAPPKLYEYTLHVNEKTRLLNHAGKDLDKGLKDARFTGAEVRVTFIDVDPTARRDKTAGDPKATDKSGKADRHVARTVQLIQPAKPAKPATGK